MSQVISQLVRRLATPAVASGLAKEELCLALAAVAQLKPWTQTSNTNSRAAAEATATTTAVPTTKSLARRSLRVLPRCSPQEIRMIAHGADALQWCAASPTSSSTYLMLDALVVGLYKHIRNRSTQSASAAQRRNRVRLQDLLAVVELSMDAGYFFSATLHVLMSEEAVKVVSDGPTLSSATAEELIAVSCAFLGERKGAELVQRIAAALPSADTSSLSGKALLERCVPGQPLPLTSVWAEPYMRWSEHRKELQNIFESPTTTDEASASGDSSAEVAFLHQQKAVFEVLRVVENLRAPSSAVEAATDDDLLKTLENVKVCYLHDPVAVATLDAALVARFAAGPLPRSTFAAYENAVYAEPQRFARALAVLQARGAQDTQAASSSPSFSSSASATTTVTGARSSAAEALQPISTLQRVYQQALAGAAVSEKDLFQLSSDVNAFTADEVAQTIFVFARARDIPSNLIMIAAGKLATMTVDGVTALLHATVYDRIGALRTLAEACLRDAAHLQRCTTAASAEALVTLAGVLSTPPTRWTTASASIVELQAQLRELVLADLHLRVDTLAWPSLVSAVRGVGRLPGSADIVREVCDRLSDLLEAALASSAPSLSREMCLDLLAALQAGDVVDERLLDLLAAAVRACFTSTAVPNADVDLLRLISLQLDYGAPEMAEVIAALVRDAAHASDWADVPVESLAAVALFALDSCNVSASLSATLSLPHRVLHHLAQADRLSESVSADVAAALVDLLFRLPTADHDVVRYGVRHVLSVADAFTPLTSARLVTVACRVALPSGEPQWGIPPSVWERVATHVDGLSPAVFTSLCRAVASPAFDDAASNCLVEALPRVADRLSPHELSQCLFGLGEMRGAGLRLSHQVMTESMSDYVVDNVELFTSARDIAALLHGFARLQCTKRNLYSVFAAQLGKRNLRYTLDFSSISFLLFAFGSAKFVDQQLVSFLCQVFVNHAEELAALDLLLALRGVSRMSLLNDGFYNALGAAVVRRADEFPLQSQCELLHAYGHVEQRHPAMVAALAQRVAQNVAALPSASAAVDVLVALWLTDYKVAANEASATIADFVLQHAGELSGADLGKLCSIMSESQWQHVALLGAMAERAVELKAQERLEAPVARVVLDALGAQFIFHPHARQELSQLARSVSKDRIQLSGEEQEQLALLISR